MFKERIFDARVMELINHFTIRLAKIPSFVKRRVREDLIACSAVRI